jgi:2,3-dihydroxybenzoate decarboxylase
MTGDIGYIALEEAVTIPGLADRRPPFTLPDGMDPAFIEHVATRLPDVADLRLQDMDAHGIAMQVLSLTVPGIEADPDPRRAVENARYVNDSLAQIVDAHPDRFAAFAALPLQDPAAAVAELHRAVEQLGLKGTLVNDHVQGAYLDDPAFDQVWASLAELDVPLACTRACRRRTAGTCSTATPNWTARCGAGRPPREDTPCAS